MRLLLLLLLSGVAHTAPDDVTADDARGQRKEAAKIGRVFQNATSPGW